MVKKEKHINWCKQSLLLGTNIFIKNLIIPTESNRYNVVIERVCSKACAERSRIIGGGFGSIDPMSNWVEPIEGDIMNLSDNLSAHVANSLSCSFDNALVQLEPQLNGIEDFINLNQTEDLLYFTHSDHLGSSSFITDLSGEAVQHLQYLPFGESFVTQTSSTSWQTRYTFSGKEKDAEIESSGDSRTPLKNKQESEQTGYSYFGARYGACPDRGGNADLSIWLSVDPLAGKYPSTSPYMYVLGNPVIYKDPNGTHNILYLIDLQGEDKKINVQRMARKAERNFRKMGLETKVVVFNLAEHGGEFDPAFTDETDAVALIGDVETIKKYARDNKIEQSHMQVQSGKAGFTDDPSNPETTVGSSNLILINTNVIELSSKLLRTATEDAAAFFVNHGFGHTNGFEGGHQGGTENTTFMSSGREIYHHLLNNKLNLNDIIEGNNSASVNTINSVLRKSSKRYGTSSVDNYDRYRKICSGEIWEQE